MTDLIKIAQRHAALDKFHTYTKLPDFQPHHWVVNAMREAYEAGLIDAEDKPKRIDLHHPDPKLDTVLQKFLADANCYAGAAANANKVKAAMIDALSEAHALGANVDTKQPLDPRLVIAFNAIALWGGSALSNQLYEAGVLVVGP